jgi:hypothetical protein
MKFNTKVYMANIQTQALGCNATHIKQRLMHKQAGHPMGNMNTVELQTPHEQL